MGREVAPAKAVISENSRWRIFRKVIVSPTVKKSGQGLILIENLRELAIQTVQTVSKN